LKVNTKITVTYTSTSYGETRTGCFKDAGNRDLPNLLRAGYGSPSKCFAEAMKGGYKYAGLQYYGECWAGNSYGKYGVRPQSECNTKCKKDSSRTCGGGWRNEIFRLKESTIPKPAGFTYKAIWGESYYGCFKDTGSRDLTTYISRNISPQNCFKQASEKGFKYAAMQYGSHCFAGNKVGKYGKRPDKECNMACTHDKARTCGGGWRNSVVVLKIQAPKKDEKLVHNVEGSVRQEITNVRHSDHRMGLNFLGCFKDAGNRDLTTYISKNISPKECFKQAREKGFEFAAMQAGSHCFGGNKVGKYGDRPEKECNSECS
jgi:hypothetical protein